MNLYSSRRLTQIEYECRFHGDECYGCAFESSYETDAEQHNSPNPILLKFREIPHLSQEAWRAGFLADSERVRFAGWSDAQTEHARRVLSRLAEVPE